MSETVDPANPVPEAFPGEVCGGLAVMVGGPKTLTVTVLVLVVESGKVSVAVITTSSPFGRLVVQLNVVRDCWVGGGTHPAAA